MFLPLCAAVALGVFLAAPLKELAVKALDAAQALVDKARAPKE
jgi:hypothetical protein